MSEKGEGGEGVLKKMGKVPSTKKWFSDITGKVPYLKKYECHT